MSGDVQPRKRKDKRRRKDELSVEEPRGTAAVFGEGDVFMHSQHDHGTGGHWCAKVIFFSLLVVLVTLIGLIILENRGLSELEANSVESRYSGVLEGWLEDSQNDDHHGGHHDEHTLELKQHDEENDERGDITDEEHNDHDDEEPEQADDEDDNETGEDADEIDADDEDDNSDDNEDDENDAENDSDDDDEYNENRDQDYDSRDQNVNSAEDEEDEDESNFRKYYKNVEQPDEDDDDDEDGDDRNVDDDYHDDESDENEDDESNEELKDDDSNEYDDKLAEDNDDSNNEDDESDQKLEDDDNDDQEDDEESNEYEDSYTTRQNEEEGDEDELEEPTDVEIEKIEKEVSDEDVLEEAAASNVEEENNSEELSNEETAEEEPAVDEQDFLEPEDIEEPVVVERITVPPGKPLPEVEEETSSEVPPDTLAEEEEYEKQQEELRRQKEQASHLWLKVVVGGALLVATQAVIRRATAPRDPTLSAEHANREDTPSAVDRRMTLIPEEPSIVTEEPEEIPPPTIIKGVEKVSTVTSQSVPLSSEKIEEEEDEELDYEIKNVESTELENDNEDKELYSDEEIEEEIEQEVELQKETIEKSVLEAKEKNKVPTEVTTAIEPEVEPDEEVPEDVEIIDDEQLEEELVEEEEEDEDDISDVDDAELLSRLEAKYGRLPEPERPAPKKDGGNSLEDEWPGEPSEQYWRQQLDEAERELRQGSWDAAERRAGAETLRGSARARYVRARALDAAAEARRDNRLLSQSIAAYLELLKMNERLNDKKLLEITNRTLDRIRFRGNYINAEPIYRLLIRRFPDDPSYRNNLSIAFLMANRQDLAEEVLKDTLRRWPDDRVALAHLGFILKTSHNKLEEAVDAMRKALEGDIGAANEPRFYFHLGDALLLLGRYEEAQEVHKRAAKLGHFLSPAQRSLYNVERLKSRPWWNVEQTPYLQLARALETSWQTILKEGEAARALYEQEKEGLKEKGEWSQLDLFVRGQELPGRCKKAPITCSIVRQEIAAVGCKRGQIKFSAMEAGTHVRPHVGPTNCRLRMHLGLSNTKDTYIRVDKETRQWHLGKVLLFDDSFEHEVWHNGTGSRLVLIVDVWHPDLTAAERRTLPAI